MRIKRLEMKDHGIEHLLFSRREKFLTGKYKPAWLPYSYRKCTELACFQQFAAKRPHAHVYDRETRQIVCKRDFTKNECVEEITYFGFGVYHFSPARNTTLHCVDGYAYMGVKKGPPP